MTAELGCICRVLLPIGEQQFWYRLVFADGKCYVPVEERIEADAPVNDVVKAFCPCAIRPDSSECIQQSRTRDAEDGSRGRRHPRCHLTGGARNDGGGDSDDGGSGDPPCDICGQTICLVPTFCAACRIADNLTLAQADCWGRA